MRRNWLIVGTLVAMGCGSGDIKKGKTGPAPGDELPTNNIVESDDPEGPSDDPVDVVPPEDTSPPDVVPPDDVTPPDDPVAPLDPMPIHVQLVWDTTQTDLDLHVAHAAAGADSRQPDLDGDGLPDPWLHPIYDCNWRNKTPDWGIVGPPNDPSSDIDILTGYGPENVNIEDPESNVAYRIGVRYYADNANEGPTTATVRVFLDGVLLAEYSQVLYLAKDMWEVATVSADGVVSQVLRNGEPKITSGYTDSVFP